MLKYIVLLFALSFSSLLAESSVWRVSKEDNSFYLGGTCHALRADDYPLPIEFDLAYSIADALVFEMDPSITKDPGFAFKLLRASSYQDNRNLENMLSKKTYKALAKKCVQSGFSIEVLNKTKPSMVIMMLMIKELTRFGVTEEGVDIHFYKRAIKDDKDVIALETAEFQIELIASLGEGIEDAIIAYGLQDIENLQANFNALVSAWKSGDIKEINKQFVHDVREYPKIHKKLLTDRNQAWLSHLEELASTPEIEFVLVGVAHMAGDSGLIALLQKKGYTVEKINASF